MQAVGRHTLMQPQPTTSSKSAFPDNMGGCTFLEAHVAYRTCTWGMGLAALGNIPDMMAKDLEEVLQDLSMKHNMLCKARGNPRGEVPRHRLHCPVEERTSVMTEVTFRQSVPRGALSSRQG
jgi:hypothetical protein